MGLFSRRQRPRPEPLPLRQPELAGDGGWPDRALAGRSFEASTYFELGGRRAFEADAHGIGEALVSAALPLLDTGVQEQDEPYLRSVFLAAARTGAGLGLVEAELTSTGAGSMSRDIASALWRARGQLPAMPEQWSRMASWFLLAGHFAARVGPSGLVRVVDGLRSGSNGRDGDGPGAQAQDRGGP